MRVKEDGTGKPWDPRKLTGVYGYYSADGMTFTATGVRVLPVLSEVLDSAFWDDAAKSYVIYLRCMNIQDKLAALQGNQFIYRPGFDYKQPEGKVGIVGPENAQEPGFENVRAIARLQLIDTGLAWSVAESGSTVHSSSSMKAMLTAAQAMEFDVLVVGVTDERWGERVTAFILKNMP